MTPGGDSGCPLGVAVCVSRFRRIRQKGMSSS